MKFLGLLGVAALCSAVFTGCSSSGKNYTLPEGDEYQGYKIIDGVDKNSLREEVSTGDKLAVVVRDIATTAYSYLPPRFNNSMVDFEGLVRCCTSTSPVMGNSGLSVYRFKFIGKGNTTIRLVARQKGLSPTANHFDTDNIVELNVKVE